MADLIDRAALLANCYILEADYDDGIEPRRAYAISIESVRNAPTVSSEPKHGKWIDGTQTSPCMPETDVCSECGLRIIYGLNYKYCPNCGAKMEKSDV